MIPSRPKADINQREETTIAFVLSLAVASPGACLPASTSPRPTRMRTTSCRPSPTSATSI